MCAHAFVVMVVVVYVGSGGVCVYVVAMVVCVCVCMVVVVVMEVCECVTRALARGCCPKSVPCRLVYLSPHCLFTGLIKLRPAGRK